MKIDKTIQFILLVAILLVSIEIGMQIQAWLDKKQCEHREEIGYEEIFR